MFTSQKIEPSLWPWAYLNSIEDQNTTQWVELRDQTQVLYNLNGIGSEHDVRHTFEDMYIDLAKDVQKGTELSIRCDQPYLS
ncbi:MAG: hypothetical protein S4CHLAM7_02510 [Chlamydiae bacterium]|nr:hypothetical protein [Chlamydiota bacterium]